MSATEVESVSDGDPVSGVFQREERNRGLAELLSMSGDKDALNAAKESVCGRPSVDAMAEIARVEKLIQAAGNSARKASQLPSAYSERHM